MYYRIFKLKYYIFLKVDSLVIRLDNWLFNLEMGNEEYWERYEKECIKKQKEK